MIIGSDFLKINYFALPIFLFKRFAQTKWAFLAFKNPNLVQSLKKFAQLYGRTIAHFRNSALGLAHNVDMIMTPLNGMV